MPRGQGGLPWRLQLTDLLGRPLPALAPTLATAPTTLTRRVHGEGEANQAVRARRAHKLTARRSTLARNANHY